MSKPRTKIVLVAGARPNFMKIAPIIRELRRHEDAFDWRLVHTGQHYDPGMSDVFFHELGIPEPDFHMGAGGGSHAEQTARIMVAFEQYCQQIVPDIVMVVGDVNSTVACSIVAKKLGVTVAHVEAGLRSGDRSMPEEINRIVTDSISDIYFVTEKSGIDNLLAEGKAANSIHFVGHVMIDNLYFQLDKLKESDLSGFSTSGLKASLPHFAVVTLHRPATVDDPARLVPIIESLNRISQKLPIIFPVHPRTRAAIKRYGATIGADLHLTEPLSYMEFLNLWKDAEFVLTDSGGLQEETTALGIPCLTARENTERPVTVSMGTNKLVGTNAQKIYEEAMKMCEKRAAKRDAAMKPDLWDGDAARRIIEVFRASLS